MCGCSKDSTKEFSQTSSEKDAIYAIFGEYSSTTGTGIVHINEKSNERDRTYIFYLVKVPSLENYKKAMLDSQQAAQEEIVQLNLLYQAAVDSSKGMNERISAVKELKKEFPQYFKNLSDEEVLVGKAADKYNELATAIMASAKAQAAKETLIKNSKEILDLESKITEEYKKQELNEVKRTEAVGKLKEGQNRTFLPVSNDVIDAVNRDYDRFFRYF